MSGASLTPEQAATLGRLVDVHPEARELGERFRAAGHELYLVGGAVRDTLLGRRDPETLDLDFATSARPEETERILRGWADTVWLTGVRFGTVSARKGHRRIEITTYRSDTYRHGSRHPEVQFGDSIEGDLHRRDFTINAMALKVPEALFVDPFGGLRDLHLGILRTPADPAESFRDDPLRMVRLARFVAALDVRPDPDTERAARELAGEIRHVSIERVREELDRLLLGEHPHRGVEVLVRTGLAAHILPEVAALTECRDPLHRHKDVYRHTLAVLRNVTRLEPEGPDLVLRLAALLHDIGKPATRRIEPDGTVSFHHHEVVGARMARERLRALRYDNRTTEDVTRLVELHLRFHTYALGWTDSAVRRYVRDAGHLLDRLNLLTRADVTTRNERKAARIQRRVDELERRIAALKEQEELSKLRPPIDGHRIMAHLGLEPGPLVGEAWRYLLELRIERGPMSEEEALAALDRWWAERSQQSS